MCTSVPNSAIIFPANLFFLICFGCSLFLSIAYVGNLFNASSCRSAFLSCWPTALSLFVPFGPFTKQAWFYIINTILLLSIPIALLRSKYAPGLHANIIRFFLGAVYVVSFLLGVLSEISTPFTKRLEEVGETWVWVLHLVLNVLIMLVPFSLTFWYVTRRAAQFWAKKKKEESDTELERRENRRKKNKTEDSSTLAAESASSGVGSSSSSKPKPKPQYATYIVDHENKTETDVVKLQEEQKEQQKPYVDPYSQHRLANKSNAGSVSGGFPPVVVVPPMENASGPLIDYEKRYSGYQSVPANDANYAPGVVGYPPPASNFIDTPPVQQQQYSSNYVENPVAPQQSYQNTYAQSTQPPQQSNQNQGYLLYNYDDKTSVASSMPPSVPAKSQQKYQDIYSNISSVSSGSGSGSAQPYQPPITDAYQTTTGIDNYQAQPVSTFRPDAGKQQSTTYYQTSGGTNYQTPYQVQPSPPNKTSLNYQTAYQVQPSPPNPASTPYQQPQVSNPISSGQSTTDYAKLYSQMGSGGSVVGSSVVGNSSNVSSASDVNYAQKYQNMQQYSENAYKEA